MFHRLATLLLVPSFLVSVVAEYAFGGVQYTVTDLGTLPGYSYGSEAYGINAAGEVVGVSGGPMSPSGHAFLYSIGTMTDLSRLGGSYSFAKDINLIRQIVGESTASSGFIHPFLYIGGSMIDLMPGAPDGYGGCAKAINASGQVVGSATGYGAFLYDGGNMTSLGTLPGAYSSSAVDINDNGQIVGYANFTSGYPSMWQHAFLYSSSDGFTDLGTLGGESSAARAINANGQVIGKSYTSSGEYHGFLYDSNSGMTDLGAINVSDINDLGQIVGSIGGHAMLYSNGVASDLNLLVSSNSGLTLICANAINNAGQIAGYGKTTYGNHRAFLATPIPEPSIFILLGGGVINLLGYVWRKRKGVKGAGIL